MSRYEAEAEAPPVHRVQCRDSTFDGGQPSSARNVIVPCTVLVRRLTGNQIHGSDTVRRIRAATRRVKKATR